MKVVDIEALAIRKKLRKAEMEKEILGMLDHHFLPTLYAELGASHYSCLVMEFCRGDPQVAISDALSSGLQITSDISSEGNVKKRKDLDTPLEPQLAKRHTGHDGIDVQYITERGRTARRTVSTTRSPTVCFGSTTVMALENNGETAFSEKSTEKQQRR
ncbi:hypothetical protein ACFX19_021767 [Malus domestica]